MFLLMPLPFVMKGVVVVVSALRCEVQGRTQEFYKFGRTKLTQAAAEARDAGLAYDEQHGSCRCAISCPALVFTA